MAKVLIDKEKIDTQLLLIKKILRADIDEPPIELKPYEIQLYKHDFYSSCYINTGNERHLKKLISISEPLICVTGGRGVGKTTTLVKVLDELSETDNVEYIRIDFLREFDLIDRCENKQIFLQMLLERP